MSFSPPPPELARSDAGHPRRILRPPTASKTTDAHISLHPLLCYTNHAGSGQPCCLLLWDFRDPPFKVLTIVPASSWLTSHPIHRRPTLRLLSDIELSQHATQPPVAHLVVTCGLFPYPWRISARSPEGVSIHDVLVTIHTFLSKPVSQSEFEVLPPPKQASVIETFYRRCVNSPDQRGEKMQGVRRADCLGIHTRFGGLSLEVQGGVSCVLTLDRNEYPEDQSDLDPHSNRPEAQRRGPEDQRRSPEDQRRSPEDQRRSLEAQRRSPEAQRRSLDPQPRSPEAQRRSLDTQRRTPEAQRRSLEAQYTHPEVSRSYPGAQSERPYA